MALIADIFLIAGALGAAFYCLILSRKLNQFRNLETGVGGAISNLSREVNEMTRALERANSEAQASTSSLDESAKRAEQASNELRQLLERVAEISPVSSDIPPPTRADVAQPTFRRRKLVAARMEAGE
ncbi:hypothetical protein [Meridianimarinicoccus aquatilis]|uniref:Uncharacterized protein n=1 Tax=Meridianimarinicoccus aquatilis TaxID=2552766 RepID=A0A4R6ATY8_9RHOB|nr:hypothetical protein [Fluviibacterium aquatile]TDL87004.1 hypothetical protein E2L05_11910 [Fluviibacterium aquatile]